MKSFTLTTGKKIGTVKVSGEMCRIRSLPDTKNTFLIGFKSGEIRKISFENETNRPEEVTIFEFKDEKYEKMIDFCVNPSNKEHIVISCTSRKGNNLYYELGVYDTKNKIPVFGIMRFGTNSGFQGGIIEGGIFYDRPCIFLLTGKSPEYTPVGEYMTQLYGKLFKIDLVEVSEYIKTERSEIDLLEFFDEDCKVCDGTETSGPMCVDSKKMCVIVSEPTSFKHIQYKNKHHDPLDILNHSSQNEGCSMITPFDENYLISDCNNRLFYSNFKDKMPCGVLKSDMIVPKEGIPVSISINKESATFHEIDLDKISFLDQKEEDEEEEEGEVEEEEEEEEELPQVSLVKDENVISSDTCLDKPTEQTLLIQQPYVTAVEFSPLGNQIIPENSGEKLFESSESIQKNGDINNNTTLVKEAEIKNTLKIQEEEVIPELENKNQKEEKEQKKEKITEQIREVESIEMKRRDPKFSRELFLSNHTENPKPVKDICRHFNSCVLEKRQTVFAIQRKLDEYELFSLLSSLQYLQTTQVSRIRGSSLDVVKAKLSFVIINGDGSVFFQETPGAYPASQQEAYEKAYISYTHSTNEGSVTSDQALSQKHMTYIYTKGGYPVYKNGELVCSIGIAGDANEVLENVGKLAVSSVGLTFTCAKSNPKDDSRKKIKIPKKYCKGSKLYILESKCNAKKIFFVYDHSIDKRICLHVYTDLKALISRIKKTGRPCPDCPKID